MDHFDNVFNMNCLMHAVSNKFYREEYSEERVSHALRIIRMAVEHGIDIDVANRMGRNALFNAVLADNRTVLRVLLELGASPLASYRNTSALVQAVLHERVQVVEMLLAKMGCTLATVYQATSAYQHAQKSKEISPEGRIVLTKVVKQWMDGHKITTEWTRFEPESN